MAVIEQDYDIDLKSTGAFPLVKCSQFDTGSREIVFTVYDNWELANIDGCLARVDGTRSDGTEFSVSCTVSTGSKVSFAINQEMTKTAGKHSAELVIFDASGNPAGTQNFIIDVEAAPMVRESAASADDRTLYDQYTDSVEQKFSELSTSLTTKADALNKTVEDISGLVGASSKHINIFDVSLDTSTTGTGVTGTLWGHAEYDPVTGLVTFSIKVVSRLTGVKGVKQFQLGSIESKFLPDDDLFQFGAVDAQQKSYSTGYDRMDDAGYGAGSNLTEDGKVYVVFVYPETETGDTNAYNSVFNAQWYARGGKYIGVDKIGTGGCTVSVGKTILTDSVSKAQIINSGTNMDVVLDFVLPFADKGYTIAGAPKASGTVEYYSVHELK